jgi:hypothetical protein
VPAFINYLLLPHHSQGSGLDDIHWLGVRLQMEGLVGQWATEDRVCDGRRGRLLRLAILLRRFRFSGECPGLQSLATRRLAPLFLSKGEEQVDACVCVVVSSLGGRVGILMIPNEVSAVDLGREEDVGRTEALGTADLAIGKNQRGIVVIHNFA